MIPEYFEFLDTYLTSSKENTIEVIEELIENKFVNVDCFIIKSLQGNGGTHLFRGTLRLLYEKNENGIYIFSDNLLREIYNNPKEIESELLKYQHIFIDDFPFSYLDNNHNLLVWFETFYDILLKSKKKLILTITANKIDEIKVPNFLNKGKIKSITSDFPVDMKCEIIEKTFQNYSSTLNTEILTYITSQDFQSVRVLKNICVTIISNAKIDKKDISSMSLLEFKNLYQKYIDYIYKENIYRDVI